MTARNFAELQMNFIRDAATRGRATPRSEWQQNKSVAADHLSQHQSQRDTHVATVSEEKKTQGFALMNVFLQTMDYLLSTPLL